MTYLQPGREQAPLHLGLLVGLRVVGLRAAVNAEFLRRSRAAPGP